jgi:hypothetical protein
MPDRQLCRRSEETLLILADISNQQNWSGAVVPFKSRDEWSLSPSLLALVFHGPALGKLRIDTPKPSRFRAPNSTFRGLFA